MAQQLRRIVLDANILIRAVLGQKVRNILVEASPRVQFFTPEICFEDAKRYLPELFVKRSLPPDDALAVLESLTAVVGAVPVALYEGREAEAKQRIEIRDPEDWPIVAVALVLDCPIWTEDRDFFGTGIATWTSDRIHLFCQT